MIERIAENLQEYQAPIPERVQNCEEVILDGTKYTAFFRGGRRLEETHVTREYSSRTDNWQWWEGEGELEDKSNGQTYLFRFETERYNEMCPGCGYDQLVNNLLPYACHDSYEWSFRGWGREFQREAIATRKPSIVDKEAEQQIEDIQLQKLAEKVKAYYQIPSSERRLVIPLITICLPNLGDLINKGLVYDSEGQRHMPLLALFTQA